MMILSSLLFAATVSAQGTNPAAVSFDVPAGAIGVSVDAAAEVGPIKPMNAVNNGPTRGADGSFRWFKGARIPFARTHDANFSDAYGGPHTVDVHVVFPNFDADETDPANYDFACTDRYLGEIRAAGSEIFYRLGASIEHQARKYGTRPPKDFAKWARICERIIRHYNEGWADGFRWDVRYWEIWNEADLDADDAADKRCWGGTEAEYFDFHEIAAKHLKAAFPHLKIGGPALAYREDWGRRFIREMARRRVPMDFFSWHCYTSKIGPTSDIRTRARWVREALDEAGYRQTESILDEWNATPHWTNDRRELGPFMGSPRGAALVAAIMSAMQDDRVDMLMYYDASPGTVYNGLFSLYGGQPRAPYFALFAWGRLAALGTQVRTTVVGSSDAYATAAKGAKGDLALLVARYDENGNWHRTEKDVRVSVKGRPLRTARVHVVDDDLLYTEVPCEIDADGSLVLRLAPAAFACVEIEPENKRPSLDAKLADYVRTFNAADDECYTNTIPNAAAEAFLLKNAPRFECPDADIERTYYFRWWTYRKHLRHTPEGWVVTEFLPNVGWAGRHNTISCALGHHFREGRWLRDRTPLKDYAAFWLRPKDGGRLNGPGAYVNWIADSVLKLAELEGDIAQATNHLTALVRNYETWEKGWNCRVFPGTGTFPMGLKGGLFETTCNYEGSELALAGDGARPLVNAAMCGEARAIAALATEADDADTAVRFTAKAAALAAAVKARLWDAERSFFMTVATNGVRGTVKELHGYAPWYFGLDLKGYEAAWKPFVDSDGFAAPWGLTFPERRTPGFAISYTGHPCQWNGPSWPYATSIALSALGEALRVGTAGALTTADFTAALCRYAAAHVRRTSDGRRLPWIDEVQNPDTGDWISRTMLERDPKNRIPERGKDYNHSTFCDLVLGELVGIRPQRDASLVVAPLFPPAWAYLRVEGVRWRGHDLSVIWDRDGTRYGLGTGLFVLVDGTVAARAARLLPIQVRARAFRGAAGAR